MTKSKQVLASALFGTTLLFVSGASQGLGFGKPVSRAILGDMLWITVPLRLEEGEEITDDCLAAEVFYGEDKVAASAVSAALMSGPGNERILKVSTTSAVSEPIVTVYLAAGCKARITRKFIAFADPPTVNQPSLSMAKGNEVADVVSSTSLPSAPVWGAPSPLLAAMQLSTHREGRASASGRSGKKSKASSRKARSFASHQSPVLARSPVKAPADATGRLELDPVATEAMFTPALRMSGMLGSPLQSGAQSALVQAKREKAAAIWLALNATPEQMARDRQHLLALAQRLTQLQTEGEQARANGLTLHAQVQQAQARAADGKMAWLWGMLALASVSAAFYLWRQLREERLRSQAWWQSENHAMDRAPVQPVAKRVSDAEVERDGAPVLTTATSPVTTPIPRKRDAATMSGHQLDVDQTVSVEALIDLEQQAEFFAVLGQDDAAISLLESHVQHTHGGSPVPLLKLLEAYHRVGQRVDFDRVSAQFQQRFQALPPEWDAQAQPGRSLADYPDMVMSLQTMWVAPGEAMRLLDKILTRPQPGSVILDLPAYRELLFLYAVARDLSEREVHERSSVDLLLPVQDTSGKAPPQRAKESVRAESLMTTRPIKAMRQAAPALEIDLPLEDLQEPADTHKV